MTSLTYSSVFSPTSVTGANGANQSEVYDREFATLTNLALIWPL